MTLTIASAPGKVLLAGGYLVLEQAFTGLVVGTSARFYTVIRPSSDSTAGTITVHSPQFDHASWTYQALAQQDKLVFHSMYFFVVVLFVYLTLTLTPFKYHRITK